MVEEKSHASEKWAAYVGCNQSHAEVVNRKELQALAALLDYPVESTAGSSELPWPDDNLPPFAHWINVLPLASQSQLGEDGHPKRGSFMPPLEFPRRMWAGSRVQRLGSYAVDQPLTHTTIIKSITPKSGRSGDMVFVTLSHQFFVQQKLVVHEEQDLVYRAAAAKPLPEPRVLPQVDITENYDFDWFQLIQPDPTLLFRYSAVTFNAHRIHYDREYARAVEYYPGLVVQGPLTATLLLDLYQRECPGQQVSEFEFRGLGALYDKHPFYLMGKASNDGADLWAVGPDGVKAMQMHVTISAGNDDG